jgi:hypothetical protein
VIVDLKKFQFLYESEGEMILMDPDTFEQVGLPLSFPASAAYPPAGSVRASSTVPALLHSVG